MSIIRKLIIVAGAALCTLTMSVQADTLRAGFSTERLARVDGLLDRYVAEERIAGIVALVLRDGKPVYQRAVGWSDKEAGRKMTMDTVFRIASQSKALTSAAIMLLMEEGKITLNEPAGKYIPTFQQTTVGVRNENGVGLTLVAAKRPITLRDLLTHTSGMSYGTDADFAALYEAKALGPVAGAGGWYTADKEEPICTTMERLGTLPFVAQPGERFVYGYNTDVLGCIVERASGVSLDEYIRSRITAPLGMRDTHFYLPPDQRERLAVVYGSGADGKAERQPEGARGQGHYVDGPRRSFSGGAGLVSTAHDYATFLEMIRKGGALGKTRVMSPHAALLMHTNQSGTLHNPNGMGFGYGFQTTDRYGASGMESVGAFGWGGAYGTWYRVDPQERLVIVLMLQLMPNTTDIRDKYQAAIYQALID